MRVHVDRPGGADPLTAWFGDSNRPGGIHTQNLAEMTPSGRRAALYSQAAAVPPPPRARPGDTTHTQEVVKGENSSQELKPPQHLVFNVHVKF